MELKNAVKEFIESKIDEVVSENPNLSIVSGRLKRGSAEWTNQLTDEFMKNPFIKGFITDENGNIDPSLFDEAMMIFKEMPEQRMSFMGEFIDVIYGKGQLKISMKQNFLTSFLVPNSGSITLKESDFKEFFELLSKK